MDKTLTSGDKVKKISNFAVKWQRYVNEHCHKDRDCHLYITQSWDYGEQPKWEVNHYGYIGRGFEEVVDSYEEALDTMLSELLKMFKQEVNWVLQVEKNESDYSSDQIKASKIFREEFSPIIGKVK